MFWSVCSYLLMFILWTNLTTFDKGQNEQTLHLACSWSAVVQERNGVEPVTGL